MFIFIRKGEKKKKKKFGKGQYESVGKQQTKINFKVSVMSFCLSSGKHVHILNTPLNPTFIVKLGYAGVYLFFLFLLQNIDCGYSLRDGSNVYPQSMF